MACRLNWSGQNRPDSGFEGMPVERFGQKRHLSVLADDLAHVATGHHRSAGTHHGCPCRPNPMPVTVPNTRTPDPLQLQRLTHQFGRGIDSNSTWAVPALTKPSFLAAASLRLTTR